MSKILAWSARTRGWPVPLRYAATILMVLATFGLRTIFADSLRGLPFLPYFVPIIAAAVIFDRGSGFVATAASALLIGFPPPLPLAAVEVGGVGASVGLGVFIFVAAICVSVIEGLHLAHAEVQRTAAELAESEERNRLIVENARDYAILTVDPDGRIRSWSRGAEAVFGHAAEEAVGQPADMIFTPEDREAGVPEQEMGKARRDGAAPDVRWHLRKDGTRIWFVGEMSVLRDSRGGEIGFLKIGRDETTAHRAEQLMREAVERQALLTREVGHRVKNNLAIINGLLSLQARSAAQEETRAALAEAQGRIDAIARVHDHLWRQDSTNSIDLDSFLRDLCAHVQPTVPRHALSYHANGEPLAVPVDRAVTLSLLVNELITNAAKYAYPGAGGAITVGLDRLRGAIRLAVADQGVGIRKPAVAEASEGGFGSRLLKGYARQLDAELAINSGGEGTRVSLVVPLAAIGAEG